MLENLSNLQLPPDIANGLALLLIIVVLFAIAWLLRKRIGKLLTIPVHVLVKKSNTDLDNFLAKSIDKVDSYLVLSIPFFVSTIILPLSESERRLLSAIGLSLFGFAIFRFIFDVVSHFFSSSQRLKRLTGYEIDAALMPLIQFCAKASVMIIGVLTIAQIWGWNIAGLVAGVGLGGLAVSLAAKDILEDILGYGVIVADNVLREKEYIVSPHAEGVVENIGVLSTRIRQLNQGLVIVPNSKLSGDWVVNWSRLEKRWFNFVVGLTYSSTGDQIQEFVSKLTDNLKSREHVQADSVVVLFTEYADSALNVLVRFYVDLPDWTDAHVEQHEVNLMIMDTVKEIGLEIAFPSRSLYFENMPEGLANLLEKASPQTQNSTRQSNNEHPRQSEKSPYEQGDDDPEIAPKEGISEPD